MCLFHRKTNQKTNKLNTGNVFGHEHAEFRAFAGSLSAWQTEGAIVRSDAGLWPPASSRAAGKTEQQAGSQSQVKARAAVRRSGLHLRRQECCSRRSQAACESSQRGQGQSGAPGREARRCRRGRRNVKMLVSQQTHFVFVFVFERWPV